MVLSNEMGIAFWFALSLVKDCDQPRVYKSCWRVQVASNRFIFYNIHICLSTMKLKFSFGQCQLFNIKKLHFNCDTWSTCGMVLLSHLEVWHFLLQCLWFHGHIHWLYKQIALVANPHMRQMWFEYEAYAK